MKYALVTGGSRGIGRAVCRTLAGSGFYVLINYQKNQGEAEITLEQIKERGGEGEILKFDVSLQEEVENSLNGWLARNEGKYISVLVNNAGIRKDALVMWMKNEEWTDVLNTNLNGFLYTTRLLIKDMIINKAYRARRTILLQKQALSAPPKPLHRKWQKRTSR
jgi:3-oxoacyl-[acyl-carrier protein] reductase